MFNWELIKYLFLMFLLPYIIRACVKFIQSFKSAPPRSSAANKNAKSPSSGSSAGKAASSAAALSPYKPFSPSWPYEDEINASASVKTPTLFSKLLSRQGLIYGITGLFVAYYLSFVFLNLGQPNLFQLTNSSLEDPVFIVRSNFKAWLEKTAASHPDFATILKHKIETRPQQSEDEMLREFKARYNSRFSFKNNSYFKILSSYFSRLANNGYMNIVTRKLRGWMAEVPYLGSYFPESTAYSFSNVKVPPGYTAWERLYDRYFFTLQKIKSPQRRNAYSKYGEHAFLHCNFYNEDFDYFYFIVPGILLSYLIFLGANGIITILPKKSRWRNIGLLFAIGMGVLEALYYLAPGELGSFDLYALLFPNDKKITAFQKLEMVRKLFFGIFLLAVMLFDNGEPKTQPQLIEALNKSLDETNRLTQVLKLVRASVAYDPTLRKEAFGYQEKLTKILEDPKILEKTDQLFAKYDVDKMIKSAKNDVNGAWDTFISPKFGSQFSEAEANALQHTFEPETPTTGKNKKASDSKLELVTATGGSNVQKSPKRILDFYEC